MKKQTVSMVALSALLLAGCSGDEIVNNNNSDLVKVELGTKAPAITTKAALFNNNWENSVVSIWGLSKNTMEDWSVKEGVSLFPTGGVNGTVTAGSPDCSITLDGDYYYPAVGGENYSFYAYYPAGEAQLLNNQLIKPYTLTGAEDVLWGNAVADTLDKETANPFYGFSAKYFRKGGLTPNVNFEHMLTRFTFEVTGGDANSAMIVVDSIRILAVPNEVSLVVADKSSLNSDYKPTLTVGGDAALWLCNADGARASLDVTHNTAQQIGESLMVPASSLLPVPTEPNKEQTYAIQIYLHSKRANSTYKDSPTKYLALLKNEAGETLPFEAGNSYKVTMTVYGETEVTINTSLTEWKDGSSVNIGELN